MKKTKRLGTAHSKQKLLFKPLEEVSKPRHSGKIKQKFNVKLRPKLWETSPYSKLFRFRFSSFKSSLTLYTHTLGTHSLHPSHTTHTNTITGRKFPRPFMKLQQWICHIHIKTNTDSERENYCWKNQREAVRVVGVRIMRFVNSVCCFWTETRKKRKRYNIEKR